jgi:hypothetical protein
MKFKVPITCVGVEGEISKAVTATDCTANVI